MGWPTLILVFNNPHIHHHSCMHQSDLADRRHHGHRLHVVRHMFCHLDLP
jgi:hypothetical protein